jgi:Tol biopolymer transport system component
MAVGICVLALLVVQNPADAALPGENGDMAFAGGHTIDPTTGFSVFGSYIYRRYSDDGLSRRLSRRGSESPSWSADGRKIAFVRANEVWIMDADGSDQVQLTNSIDYKNVDPAWFPGGGRIVISSDRHRKGAPTNIYILKLNAARDDVVRVRQLTNHPSRDFQPVVSPSGRKIAFVSRRNGDEPAIFTMRTDSAEGYGGNNIPLRLTTNVKSYDDPDTSPDWSPDGKRIVFTSQPPDRGPEIHVMDANGDHNEALTDGRSPGGGMQPVRSTKPVFSPDGQKIAFIRYEPHDDQRHWPWVMDADGSDPVEISIQAPPGEPYFWHNSYVAELDWQPVQ